MIVCGPPSGLWAASALAGRTLLLGALPVAALALILDAWTVSAGHTWSAGWARPFRAGFVFQVSSLALTAMLAVAMLSSIGPAHFFSVDWPLSFATLLGILTGSVFGLRSWTRLLSVIAPTSPLSITAGR